MKKEWLLLAGSVMLTLLASLGILSWLAPGLLGMAPDLQLVQIDKKVPPFYEGALRREDYQTNKFLLQDPITRIRARPLLPLRIDGGPHDILGFRNPAVPNIADVVTIGDSMTYGNNALMGENWPSQLRGLIDEKPVSVYNMSTGGWGAVQYLNMFTNATLFQPRVIVVAFYTGNDPLDSFLMAYGNSYWDWLRPDSSLTKADAPQVAFPAPEEQRWPVSFADGVSTVFTPNLRLASNSGEPAAAAGYAIMEEVARRISQLNRKLGTRVVFTVIPTKELVYERKVRLEKLSAPEAYRQLVANERAHINRLETVIRTLPNADYIDVLTPLQNAALGSRALYLTTGNGHPVAAGYEIIARTIASGIEAMIPPPPSGEFILNEGDILTGLVINAGKVWFFNSPQIMAANGWSLAGVPEISRRDIAGLEFGGMVNEINPGKYGPTKLALDDHLRQASVRAVAGNATTRRRSPGTPP